MKLGKNFYFIVIAIFIYLVYLQHSLNEKNTIGEVGGIEEDEEDVHIPKMKFNKEIELMKTKYIWLPYLAIQNQEVNYSTKKISESDQTDFIINNLFYSFPHSSSVIEIGSKIGWYSLISLSHNKHVFAFEPNDQYLEVFHFTLRLYKKSFRKNLFLYPFPASDSPSNHKFCENEILKATINCENGLEKSRNHIFDFFFFF